MNQLLHQFSKKFCKASVPDIRPGYLVKVHQKIKEGTKERIQAFEGTVIAVNAGHGVESTFTVRKISEGIGVEKVFPIHSPNVVKVDVLRAHKVRRAKLRFLRELSGKALRLKEVDLKLEHKEFESDSVDTTPDKQEEESIEAEKPEESVSADTSDSAKATPDKSPDKEAEEVVDESVSAEASSFVETSPDKTPDKEVVTEEKVEDVKESDSAEASSFVETSPDKTPDKEAKEEKAEEAPAKEEEKKEEVVEEKKEEKAE
jgi:large subunit ribosomal protein L19